MSILFLCVYGEGESGVSSSKTCCKLGLQENQKKQKGQGALKVKK